MSKVSIIVPVYNPGNRIKKCIKSILNQTFTEFELILVNDGSTDRSLEICNKYANKDKRIKVINQNNQGSILARKRGILESKSKYITFVDSDDWIDKSLIEELYNAITFSESDISVCNLYKVIGNSKLIKKDNKSIYFEKDKVYSGKEIKDNLVEAYLHGHPFPSGLVCKMYRRELLMNSGKYLERIRFLGDDLFYNIEIFLKASKVKVISKSLYYYRVGGFTGKYMPYHFDDIVNGYNIQKEIIEEYYKDTKQKRYNGISIMLLNSFKTSISNLIFSRMNQEEIKLRLIEYINNESIVESTYNNGSIRYFEPEFISAIQNKNVEYLYNLGLSINKKNRLKRNIKNIMCKLNII